MCWRVICAERLLTEAEANAAYLNVQKDLGANEYSRADGTVLKLVLASDCTGLRLRICGAGAGFGRAAGDDGQTDFAGVSKNRRFDGKICEEEKMSRKLNITVMLGGPSAEREVSLRSGAAVAPALRSLGHTVTELDPRAPDWILPPKTDVVFLALHGTYGEDGTVQKQLDKLGVPYTGCDAEASRIAFDKVLTKQRCIEAGVPTAKFLVVNSPKAAFPENFLPPLVVKPSRQGSSVGLQFVERVADWPGALAEALNFDSEVLVEEKIVGRETTVGILGGQALPVVEVRPKSGSYDYTEQIHARQHGIFLPGGF